MFNFSMVHRYKYLLCIVFDCRQIANKVVLSNTKTQEEMDEIVPQKQQTRLPYFQFPDIKVQRRENLVEAKSFC